MPGVTRYELLSGSDSQKLSTMVNDKIREGWQPFGSPVAFAGQIQQAVVLTGDDEKRIRKTSED